jgi:hypothetical protein
VNAFRPRFTTLIPLIWGAICVVSFFHPGGGYTLWCLGSLPGLWVILLRGTGGDIHGFLLPVTVAGTFTMALLGLISNALRARQKPFLIAWLGMAGILFLAVLTFSDRFLQRASTPAEGLLSLGLAAVNTGLWIAVLTFMTGSFAAGLTPLCKLRASRAMEAEKSDQSPL